MNWSELKWMLFILWVLSIWVEGWMPPTWLSVQTVIPICCLSNIKKNSENTCSIPQILFEEKGVCGVLLVKASLKIQLNHLREEKWKRGVVVGECAWNNGAECQEGCAVHINKNRTKELSVRAGCKAHSMHEWVSVSVTKCLTGTVHELCQRRNYSFAIEIKVKI